MLMMRLNPLDVNTEADLFGSNYFGKLHGTPDSEAEASPSAGGPLTSKNSHLTVTIKNTFIDVNVLSEKPVGLRRSSSAPDLPDQFIDDASNQGKTTNDDSSKATTSDDSSNSSTKASNDDSPDSPRGSQGAPEQGVDKAELHRLGHCTPCGYFVFKRDACRKGDDCEFCHLCTQSEIIAHTKARKKAGKLRRREEAAAAAAAAEAAEAAGNLVESNLTGSQAMANNQQSMSSPTSPMNRMTSMQQAYNQQSMSSPASPMNRMTSMQQAMANNQSRMPPMCWVPSRTPCAPMMAPTGNPCRMASAPMMVPCPERQPQRQPAFLTVGGGCPTPQRHPSYTY